MTQPQRQENKTPIQPPQEIMVTPSVRIKQSVRPFSYWLKKNRYYHNQIKKFYQRMIEPQARVLQVSCKNGYLLAGVAPKVGIGIEEDPELLAEAKLRHPENTYYAFLKDVPPQEFDYIILSGVTMETEDIHTLLEDIAPFCNAKTRIIIGAYSYLWKPVLWLTQALQLRRKTLIKNWLSLSDLRNILHLAGFEKVIQGRGMLLPIYIPLVSAVCNTFLAQLPLISRVCLHEVIVAHKKGAPLDAHSVSASVIIPCRNERGTIEGIVQRMPAMGSHTELIFVEGHSKDGTLQEIERVMGTYPEKNISCYVQEGKGKADAVKKGFAQAKGDVLIIFDADATVSEKEMPLFFNALVTGKGEFINGCRLIYGMEHEAMWGLSLLANIFFSRFVSWITRQRMKDTLCGTKVMWRADYERLAPLAPYWGYDPFGDFTFIFGAAKLNLKIIDLPVHYKNRTYGTTQISRFTDGWLLLFICLRATKVFRK